MVSVAFVIVVINLAFLGRASLDPMNITASSTMLRSRLRLTRTQAELPSLGFVRSYVLRWCNIFYSLTPCSSKGLRGR